MNQKTADSLITLPQNVRTAIVSVAPKRYVADLLVFFKKEIETLSLRFFSLRIRYGFG